MGLPTIEAFRLGTECQHLRGIAPGVETINPRIAHALWKASIGRANLPKERVFLAALVLAKDLIKEEQLMKERMNAAQTAQMPDG